MRWLALAQDQSQRAHVSWAGSEHNRGIFFRLCQWRKSGPLISLRRIGNYRLRLFRPGGRTGGAASNQVTRFGGFFDSVIDRYSDASQFFGLLVFYARGDRFFYVVLTAFVMVSAIMVSYTRARAESLIGSCRVGFMERPERLVLVIIGALFNRMAPVLWLIAVLSTITVIHRIRYTWTRTEGVDALPAKAGQAA